MRLSKLSIKLLTSLGQRYCPGRNVWTVYWRNLGPGHCIEQQAKYGLLCVLGILWIFTLGFAWANKKNWECTKHDKKRHCRHLKKWVLQWCLPHCWSRLLMQPMRMPRDLKLIPLILFVWLEKSYIWFPECYCHSGGWVSHHQFLLYPPYIYSLSFVDYQYAYLWLSLFHVWAVDLLGRFVQENCQQFWGLER